MIAFFLRMIADEECIVIEPRPEHFRKHEYDFLEGLRRIPAKVVAPPGRNPYSYALGEPGHWLMIWIPDK